MLYFRPVLFHRPHNLVSKGIRLVTGSYWNHAGAYFVDENNLEWFIEAKEGGVKEPISWNMIVNIQFVVNDLCCETTKK